MEKVRSIKKEGRNTKRILVLFVLLGIITALAPAAQAAVLWVVPDDNPTQYTGPNDEDFNFLSDETVIVDTNMGLTLSGDVLVLNQESPQNVDAETVYLKFFVLNASNIDDITIGTAKRIQPGTPPTVDDPNPNSTPDVETSTFSYVAKDAPVPAGWGVKYLIGDIPFSGGPSQTGNIDDDNFNPDNASYYIRVPFTINFITTPEVGFTLYAYAENDLTGKEHAKTAYSHDGGYTHVPEFSTIAIPVAAILGLLFFFNHRKRRKTK